MDNEFVARFLPRFVETANARLQRLAGLFARRGDEGSQAQVRGEFHGLAGEASMLGLAEIGRRARDAEDAAVAWQRGDPEGMMPCLRALRTLSQAIARLYKPQSGHAAEEHDVAARGFRVLVVDASAVEAAFVDALEAAEVVVGEVTDGDDLGAALCASRPGRVLADVDAPGRDLSALVVLVRARSDAKLFLLSRRSGAELELLVGDLGADGVVSTSAGPEALVAAVESAAASTR